MKIIKFLVLVSFLSISAGLFAQNAEQNASQTAGDDDLYVYQLPLERVYINNYGYGIKYKNGVFSTAMSYLPIEWFNVPPGNTERVKGELILMGPGSVWPHAAFYYKNGVLDYVKLYVRKEMGHPSWGTMPPYAEYKEYFNVTPETFKLDLNQEQNQEQK